MRDVFVSILYLFLIRITFLSSESWIDNVYVTTQPYLYLFKALLYVLKYFSDAIWAFQEYPYLYLSFLNDSSGISDDILTQAFELYSTIFFKHYRYEIVGS